MSMKLENETKKSTMKEIKLTLQQTVNLAIDDNWTMNDIKKAAKREFGHIADLFTVFIKDYEVTNLESINLLRTLDYYKSNTIYIVPRINKILNEKIINDDDNYNILSLNNSHSLIQSGELLNSSAIHNKSRLDYLYGNKDGKYGKGNTINFDKNPENVAIKNRIDDAYNNLDKLKRTISDFNVRSELGLNKSYYNMNEKNASQILENKNNSFNNFANNASTDNLNNNPLSSSMFLSKNKNLNINTSLMNKDFVLSPIRDSKDNRENRENQQQLTNLNSQPYSKVDEILTNIKNKLNMPKTVETNLTQLKPLENINNKNESFLSMTYTKNGFGTGLVENASKGRQQLPNTISYPSINLNNVQLKFPQSEEDLKLLLEDNRNIHLTNQILNKSNIELKNQLKRLEEESESNSDLKLKVTNLNQFIENLKVEMSNLIKSNEDVVRIYDMLKADYIEAEKENEALKQKLQNLSENFFVTEKTNHNLKTGIERFEDALKNYDNEKSILSIHIMEKEKQIFELSEKDKNNYELNQSLKKSLNDYEEMLANMNRTIEILKKSTDDCEKEIFKLKCIIDEKNTMLEAKSRDIVEREKENSNLNDELNLIRNELKFFNEEVQAKLRILDELHNKNSDLSTEVEKHKMKIESLTKIIEEKENTVETMKISYNALNKTLEEIKSEYDDMKRKYADDLIEKNRMINQKKYSEEFTLKLEKKIEELLIGRNEYENELRMNKNIISQLEEENSKLKLTNETYLKDLLTFRDSSADKEKLVQSLEIKVKDYEEKINKIKNELERVEKQKNEINSERNVFESKFNELQIKHENLLQKFNNNLAFSGDLNKKYEALLQQNYKINVEKRYINDTYEKLDKDFKDLIKQASNTNPNPNLKTNLYSNLISNLSGKNEFTVSKIEEVSDNFSKIQIIGGSKFIFTIYDGRSILSFDLENRKFKVSEFADYGDFEENYQSEGSISLNVEDGMFIITGENHDIVYYYSYNKNTMSKLIKLRDNHAHGGLIIDNRPNIRKSLICLSGWHNRKVERYYIDDLVRSTNNSIAVENNSVYSKQKFSKNNELSYLAEMTVERSESSYMIIDDKYLYAFFGYCCPKAKYLDTIEYLDLSGGDKWETLKYSNEQHISTFLKSHSLVKISNRDILIIGGYDGKNEVPIETLLKFDNVLVSISTIDRKLPDINVNHYYNFQKDSSFVPFIDINDRINYASIDDMDNVHMIEVKTMQYDVFKFD